MLKSYLLIVAILSLHFATAQIPNSGFESWTDFGSFDDPDDWYTPNLQYGGDPELVRMADDSYTGIYAARLENKEDDNNNVIRAMMICGGRDLNNHPGFAYDHRPPSLNGFFTYNPNDDDSCSIKVSLWKYNTLTLQRDLVGYGTFTSAEEVEVFTMFTAPITYVSEFDPDTAVIEIYAGRQNGFEEGSRFIVDELKFEETATAIQSISETAFSLYPNPVSDFFIMNLSKEVSEIQITDLTGVKVKTIAVNSLKQLNVSVAGLKGIFYVNAFSKEGKMVGNKKIMVGE
jgi:hypothetical protein